MTMVELKKKSDIEIKTKEKGKIIFDISIPSSAN